MKPDTLNRVRQDRLKLRLEIERLRTVRCVMWSTIGLMFSITTACVWLMAHFEGQGNPAAAQRFTTVLVAMFPSLSSMMVAVTATIKRDR